MIILKIGVVAITTVVSLALLKNYNSTFVPIIEITLICVVIILVLPQVKEIINIVSSLNSSEKIDAGLISVLIKIFFISLIGSFVGDICRDNGENALGSVIEFAVKLVCLSVALPIFKAVISVAQMFFNR